MFPLKQILNNTVRAFTAVRPIRPMSTSPLVDLKIDDEGIAVLTLQRPPVNSLNLDLLQAISKSLDEVAKSESLGMILTSSAPTTFSAGLDLMEMLKPDAKRIEMFWTTLQEVWLKLFGSNFVTSAAINGHAPAGGCLLALSCEHRAMVTGKYSIGLNETALGIVAPTWFIDSLNHTIPTRQAELALTTGKMFPVDEALKVGLIDEIATDKADAIEKSKRFISKFENIPPLARSLTKQKIRGDLLKKLKASRKEDLKEFIDFVTSPQVQQGLEMYLYMLKQKSAK